MADASDLQSAFVLVFYQPLVVMAFLALLAALFLGIHLALFAAIKNFKKRGGAPDAIAQY